MGSPKFLSSKFPLQLIVATVKPELTFKALMNSLDGFNLSLMVCFSFHFLFNLTLKCYNQRSLSLLLSSPDETNGVIKTHKNKFSSRKLLWPGYFRKLFRKGF